MNGEETLKNVLIFGTLFYALIHSLVFILLGYLGLSIYNLHGDNLESIRKWRKRSTIAFVIFTITFIIAAIF